MGQRGKSSSGRLPSLDQEKRKKIWRVTRTLSRLGCRPTDLLGTGRPDKGLERRSGKGRGGDRPSYEVSGVRFDSVSTPRGRRGLSVEVGTLPRNDRQRRGVRTRGVGTWEDRPPLRHTEWTRSVVSGSRRPRKGRRGRGTVPGRVARRGWRVGVNGERRGVAEDKGTTAQRGGSVDPRPAEAKEISQTPHR